MEKRCLGCMQLKTQSPICEHCGYNETVQNLSHQLPAGTLLHGQYMVGRVLGQGGFGITYMGWDNTLGVAVAIKEYYPNSVATRECTRSLMVSSTGANGGINFDHNRERFLREARMLARLGWVPGIVRVYNLFEENGTAYIVMEYVKGMDLRQYVQRAGGRLRAAQTLHILRPILEALEKVHNADLVHRDISPDNIMVLPDGSAKLLDFGAVREVVDADAEKELVQSTEAILKHGFAPLEQYQKRGTLGPWTDVYALCGTIYYCLMGKVPPDAPARMVDEVEMGWETIPGLTESQIDALEQGMALRARDRLANVGQLYEALYQAGSLDSIRDVIPEPEKKKKPSREEKQEEAKPRRAKAPAVIAALLILILAAGGVLLGTGTLNRMFPGLGKEQLEATMPTETRQPETMAPEILAAVTVPEITVPETTVPETTIPVETMDPDAWKNNILMDGSDMTNQYVFNTKILRRDVDTITFLDTVANAPKDAWDFSKDRDKSVLGWVTENGQKYDLYIAGEGGVGTQKNTIALFYGYGMRTIHFNNAFHMDNGTTMKVMFAYCPNLETLDLSSWDTPNVEDMTDMFHGCEKLTTLNVTGLETGRVKDMRQIFMTCRSLKSLDLSSWDTGRCTTMLMMFNECRSLETLNVTGLDTSAVTDMRSMFANCEKLNKLDLSTWNTGRVKDMTSMFSGCWHLDEIDLGSWETYRCVEYSDFMEDGKFYNGRPWEIIFSS